MSHFFQILSVVGSWSRGNEGAATNVFSKPTNDCVDDDEVDLAPLSNAQKEVYKLFRQYKVVIMSGTVTVQLSLNLPVE